MRRAAADRRPAAAATSFLPAAHIADRWARHYYVSMMYGCTVTSIADPRTVAIHLPEVRPTVWGARAAHLGEAQGGARGQGRSPTRPRCPRRRKAAIRDAARARPVRSGWCAAPRRCPIEVLEYFDALGLPILEVWGMSETVVLRDDQPAGRVALRHLRHRRSTASSSSSPTTASCSCAAPIVMARLPRRAGEDREAIDDDGWLHTGDIGDDRRRRLPDDRRPQEGADHQRGRQEHVARPTSRRA